MLPSHLDFLAIPADLFVTSLEPLGLYNARHAKQSNLFITCWLAVNATIQLKGGWGIFLLKINTVSFHYIITHVFNNGVTPMLSLKELFSLL